MGLVARYLDALRDEQRDRVIEATELSDLPGNYIDPNTGCGCLVAVAESDSFDEMDGYPVDVRMSSQAGSPGDRFAFLCHRFGTERITRLCKERAAKANEPTVREVQRFRQRVYRDLKASSAEATTR